MLEILISLEFLLFFRTLVSLEAFKYIERRNILSQLQLIVLVWPSSPPDTAHLFIFELFVPILPRIQLI